MLQTILAGLDWGETVDAVAETSVELALALKASVKALYVEDAELIRATERAAIATLPESGPIPLDAPKMGDLETHFRSEERVLGKRFLRLVADTRIKGSFLVAEGEVAQILIAESRAHDLLVMGKYSEHPSVKVLDRPLGRHVERVLRAVWCPTVLVPPGRAIGERFLLAYDGSAGSHRALATLVRLVMATHGQMEALVIARPALAEQYVRDVEVYLDSHHLAATVLQRDGEPVEEILREAERWDAGLVAMGAFGPARHRGSFGAGVTVDVLRRLDRLVLVCGTMEED